MSIRPNLSSNKTLLFSLPYSLTTLTTTYVLFVATLPFTVSVLYLIYLHRTLSRKVSCRTTPYLLDSTIPIPSPVKNNPASYLIHHELAQKSVPTTSLTPASKSETLTLFLRHTMSAFSRYPPAWGIWYLLKGLKEQQTFNAAYIRSLNFQLGDRVCGVYVVSSRTEQRATLSLDAPESYIGPLVEGLLTVEIKEEENSTTFSNHTVMWRERGKGRRGVLETVGGRWMHGLMVKGLIMSSLRLLLEERRHEKSLRGVQVST